MVDIPQGNENNYAFGTYRLIGSNVLIKNDEKECKIKENI
jgi:hypothetical protein